MKLTPLHFKGLTSKANYGRRDGHPTMRNFDRGSLISPGLCRFVTNYNFFTFDATCPGVQRPRWADNPGAEDVISKLSDATFIFLMLTTNKRPTKLNSLLYAGVHHCVLTRIVSE